MGKMENRKKVDGKRGSKSKYNYFSPIIYSPFP
jgi:hypothetical protein